MNGISADLKTWQEVDEEYEHSVLLLGNGASRAIWDGFSYPSLFEVARDQNFENPLSDDDVAMFEAFQTTNFELVLSNLRTACIANESVGQDTRLLTSSISSIRDSLIEAVNLTHVPWRTVDESEVVLPAVWEVLRANDFVFSSNYDLLIYWAKMSVDGGCGIEDYFRDGDFRRDIRPDRRCTKILFLHGGIHLYKKECGTTLKRSRTQELSLLELFGIPFEDASPLFVAEGTAREKMVAIDGSDYLSFAYDKLKSVEGGLVVFCHSLGPSDAHICSAIRSANLVTLTVGLLPGGGDEICRNKARILGEFPNGNVDFFDATTHPLGSPELRLG